MKSFSVGQIMDQSEIWTSLEIIAASIAPSRELPFQLAQDDTLFTMAGKSVASAIHLSATLDWTGVKQPFCVASATWIAQRGNCLRQLDNDSLVNLTAK